MSITNNTNNLSKFSLENRVALVTGANTGIGQAIAVGLAEAGAQVICASRSSCEQTLSLIPGAQGLHLDFADPMAAKDIFENRQIDILVNNAGIIRRNDALDFTEQDWDDVIDTNMKALFFTCQAFGRAAIKRKSGKIINIASLLSYQGGIRVPSYTASKHGVAGITKALANEWAAHNINVNAIAPGYIKTNNTQALQDDETRNQSILARIPAGRWGNAEDIAGAAVFLASDAAGYIHGNTLEVDGGWMGR